MRRRGSPHDDVPHTVESFDAYHARTSGDMRQWRAHRFAWAKSHPDLLTPLDALLGFQHVAYGRGTSLQDGLYLHADGSRRRTP